MENVGQCDSDEGDEVGGVLPALREGETVSYGPWQDFGKVRNPEYEGGQTYHGTVLDHEASLRAECYGLWHDLVQIEKVQNPGYEAGQTYNGIVLDHEASLRAEGYGPWHDLVRIEKLRVVLDRDTLREGYGSRYDLVRTENVRDPECETGQIYHRGGWDCETKN